MVKKTDKPTKKSLRQKVIDSTDKLAEEGRILQRGTKPKTKKPTGKQAKTDWDAWEMEPMEKYIDHRLTAEVKKSQELKDKEAYEERMAEEVRLSVQIAKQEKEEKAKWKELDKILKNKAEEAKKPQHVSEPVNMFFVPKLPLVRFKPRELRIGRYNFDTTKHFVVLFDIEQIPNHVTLCEISSGSTGKVVSMVNVDDLEMVPVDEA